MAAIRLAVSSEMTVRAHGRLDLFDDVPILVQDLPDDIGLHQPPAVRHTGEAGDHLDGCDLEGLPNGGGRHVHRTDAFLHMVEGGGDPRLSQHIDAGQLGKTERGVILAEQVPADHAAERHEGRDCRNGRWPRQRSGPRGCGDRRGISSA